MEGLGLNQLRKLWLRVLLVTSLPEQVPAEMHRWTPGHRSSCGLATVSPARCGASGSGPLSVSEDQRKHLDFIQAVIARLASSSAAAKGWGLTVATAAFGFSATKAVPVLAGLVRTAAYPVRSAATRVAGRWPDWRTAVPDNRCAAAMPRIGIGA